MIDTHSHIYGEEFDADRAEVVERARQAGVTKIILPNVDAESLPRMLAMEAAYPDFCYAAIGLHPTSVDALYKQALEWVHNELERRTWTAIGEIGIDLYWDKTFINEQTEAFRQQIEWAVAYKLPVIIHTRNSIQETLQTLKPYCGSGLTGVFHCFSGTEDDAKQIIDLGGFKLGIGGVLTFKNSTLPAVLRTISPEHLILETDAPYLTPAPYRGKRNESAYVKFTALKLAEVYGCSVDDISEITTRNAQTLFKL